MSGSRRILVLGDDTRSFLATIRSLGAAGLDVHAAPFKFRAPALASKFIGKIHRLPYYLGDGREWLDAVSRLLRENRFDLVIPCDERALIPLHRHRESLSQHSRLAIPDARAFETLFDKHNTRTLATALGIPVAPGGLIDATVAPSDLAAKAGFPLAIKPRASYTLDRLYSRNRVEIVFDMQELSHVLASAPGGGACFFEAFFAGTGVGLSVLANRGRILQAFQHRRERELHGSSYYRVSSEISPPLLDAAAKLAAELSYTGIAMLEFRVDTGTGDWILLEVNARPWGSLPLPTALGIDFPYRWYRLLVDNVETPARPYPIGMYGRNLVPDARQVLLQARSMGPDIRNRLRFWFRTMKEYSRILVGRELYDVLKPHDPQPGFRELAEELGALSRGVAERLPGYAASMRFRDRRRLRRALGRPEKRERDVVLVCQGNICRSPFAASLLRKRLRGIPRLRVLSAGNLPRENAASPVAAIDAARGYGVDLRQRRSTHFSAGMAKNAALVVIFDQTNRRWIEERYPSLAARVVMLGSFTQRPSSNPIIRDPDGGDAAQFQQVYSEIEKAVAGLAQTIRRAVR
ncbi:MAG: ATP-grasp domain-containing protein [Rhizomicrobium sp.]